MSLTYPQMLALCNEIKLDLLKKSLTGCFEKPSRYFQLTFNTATTLLICLQPPFLRFHLTDRVLDSPSPFTQNMGSYLLGKVLTNMQILNQDRILELTFSDQKTSYYLIAELFSKKPNLFLLDAQKRILLAYHPTTRSIYELPNKPHSSTPISQEPVSGKAIAQFYREQEQAWALDQAKIEIEKILRRKIKGLEKQKQEVTQNIANCLEWETVQHRAQLLQSVLYQSRKGMKQIKAFDWLLNREVVIDLDPLTDPKKQAEQLFQKSKKLKRGIAHWQLRLSKVTEELLARQQLLQELVAISSFKELKKFKKFTEQKKIQKHDLVRTEKKPYRLFYSSEGDQIWVGKSARENDEMTFKHAKGSDWWLHVHNYPGSHLVIRVKKGNEPSLITIQEAMQLAIGYSQAKNKGSADVCITQCKYVNKLKQAAAGKVSISHHRILHATFDPIKFAHIKTQLAPPYID